MGANDYVLAVYAVSGTLAFGCAFLPGAGPVGRLLSILAGVGLLGWTANAYLLNGWYLTSPLIAAVPLVLLAYATFTLSRLRHSYHEEWFSPAYRARARRLAAAAPRTGPDRRGPDRRGPDRRVLPGEYGGVPINQSPPPHDPWAALYASAEREALRADGGRHRPPARVRTAGRHSYDTLTPATYIPVQARPSGYAATQAACGARQAEATALQTTYADVEADFEAWQAQCASARPGPGSWWPDGRSGPAE